MVEWIGSWPGDTESRRIAGIFRDASTVESTYDFNGSQTRRLI